MAPVLDTKVSDALKQAVYAFASFGSAEPRVDLDGKVRFGVWGVEGGWGGGRRGAADDLKCKGQNARSRALALPPPLP
jgi:hypothetical protein